jgi:HEAT repeat protein
MGFTAHPSTRAGQSHMKHVTLRALALALSLSVVTGCSTTKNASTSDLSETRWVRASPILEQQLRDAAEQLPWAKGLQKLELIRYFANVGEPAYDLLVELAQDPSTAVATSAYSAMGASRDGRLVEEIHKIDWNPAEATQDLRLERARTLARLGDWSTLPELIRGLEDDRLYTRALCDQALREITKERINFDPRGEIVDRELAIQAWERWWLKYSGKPMPPRVDYGLPSSDRSSAPESLED